MPGHPNSNLIAHKMIDVLRGRIVDGRTYRHPPNMEDGRQYAHSLAEKILEAEKFDFGRHPVDCRLTDAEIDAFGLGLVPFPAPLCWYEAALPENRRVGYLLEKKSESVFSILYIPWPSAILHGFDIRVDYSRWHAGDRGYDFTIRHHYNEPNRSWYTENQGSLTTVINVVCYLTLMINSRSTERTWHEAPARLNAARAKQGRTPLFSHHIVDIVPQSYLKAQGDGSHASPRLHWRRSHLRVYQSGLKVIIPRHLVGRAELGEVSHEYRVR